MMDAGAQNERVNRRAQQDEKHRQPKTNGLLGSIQNNDTSQHECVKSSFLCGDPQQ